MRRHCVSAVFEICVFLDSTEHIVFSCLGSFLLVWGRWGEVLVYHHCRYDTVKLPFGDIAIPHVQTHPFGAFHFEGTFTGNLYI